MSFMQPRVFTANVYAVNTEVGSELVLEETVGKNASREDFSQYVEGEEIGEVELIENAVLGHLTAPGYMDRTDFVVYNTEQEAWEDLIGIFPDAFTWSVEHSSENPTAHIYAACNEAAKALSEAVQSIDGSRLEVDGSFVYAVITSPEDATNELLDHGFETKEVS